GTPEADPKFTAELQRLPNEVASLRKEAIALKRDPDPMGVDASQQDCDADFEGEEFRAAGKIAGEAGQLP
ncbi:unnamed protein product, partial [Prorocentrum cordatum]